MVVRSSLRPLTATNTVRRLGLVVRVSTDRQAMNDEGSLVNQLQRLRQHIAYKKEVGGEDWEEVALYELRAVSGKDSIRSKEFARLFADITDGRVNTILCASLDRICRSVRDFLHFFEVLSEHGVEFVCLKQNYDTTSPQGRLFVTIMMALAEFEREQTSERTREAANARSERGLWNGGRLLGYDLDPDRKGYLVPNDNEAFVVRFAFAAYLDSGPLKQTAERLNAAGHRTKQYLSRRGREHPDNPFQLTTLQHLLRNHAYIGKKQLGAGEDLRLVDAVWPALIEPELFADVQQRMKQRGRSQRASSLEPYRAYPLRGLTFCALCGAALVARSGRSRARMMYFYYVCPQKVCRLTWGADELEERVARLLSSGDLSGAVSRGVSERTGDLTEASVRIEVHRNRLLIKPVPAAP